MAGVKKGFPVLCKQEQRLALVPPPVIRSIWRCWAAEVRLFWDRKFCKFYDWITCPVFDFSCDGVDVLAEWEREAGTCLAKADSNEDKCRMTTVEDNWNSTLDPLIYLLSFLKVSRQSWISICLHGMTLLGSFLKVQIRIPEDQIQPTLAMRLLFERTIRNYLGLVA